MGLDGDPSWPSFECFENGSPGFGLVSGEVAGFSECDSLCDPCM